MRFSDDGVLNYSDKQIKEFAEGQGINFTDREEAAKDWMERQWTSPKIGDRFTQTGETYILCAPEMGKVALINIETGRRVGGPYLVQDSHKVSKEEWDKFQLHGTYTPVEKTNEI